MKLEIYDDTKPVADPLVLLQLKKVEGGIDVVAVDAAGNVHNSGYLLRFNRNGTVYLYRGVNDAIGFQVTEMGRLQLQ